jgi:hypothetical protein
MPAMKAQRATNNQENQVAGNLKFGVIVMDASDEARMYDDAYDDRYQMWIGGFPTHEEARQYRDELAEALEDEQRRRDIVLTFSGIREPRADRADEPESVTPAIDDVIKELLSQVTS